MTVKEFPEDKFVRELKENADRYAKNCKKARWIVETIDFLCNYGDRESDGDREIRRQAQGQIVGMDGTICKRMQFWGGCDIKITVPENRMDVFLNSDDNIGGMNAEGKSYSGIADRTMKNLAVIMDSKFFESTLNRAEKAIKEFVKEKGIELPKQEGRTSITRYLNY